MTINFDHNATTPIAPEVAAAMTPFLLEHFGNPSSTHAAGVYAHSAIEMAREQISVLLGCDQEEVLFTSGGSESNNAVLKGLLLVPGKVRPHVILSTVEHPSVTVPCHFLERNGVQVSQVRVDRDGRVDPDDVRREIRPETRLISIMHSNNEVGTLQPIDEIAVIAKEAGVLMHTDAAQSAGKVEVNTDNIDFLTIAGHKLHGPKGVGALIVRNGVQFEPLIHGAAHESGRRAGTENVASNVGLGIACRLATKRLPSCGVGVVRDYFWTRLREVFDDRVTRNGSEQHCLPNTLNVSFHRQEGHDLLARLKGVYASCGAACHASTKELSPVLHAMGRTRAENVSAIRFSLGCDATINQCEQVVEKLVATMETTQLTAYM